VVISAAFVGNSLGFFCATLFRELDRVVPLTNIVMIPLLILSGIFNKLGSMP
jgi:ABC-type polysaccharide/polyol phosphate export permease